MTPVIHLPEIPARDRFPDNRQFVRALAAWRRVCTAVVRRSSGVEPAAMPQRERYLNADQYLSALAAWEAVFCEEARPQTHEFSDKSVGSFNRDDAQHERH